jgi:AraC family transcriptional regulator of adaptative response/methylated-DNA-[protein]-cysteine methyltransferase
MYQALLRKDSNFEGVFFTAVKTTGIFCRPTCTARKPKTEHVEFFATAQECLTRGYRPCKRCRPLELPQLTPVDIQALLSELQQNPEQKIKNAELRERGIAPDRLRRWFLKHHGITFHAYQRMLRINTAFEKLQEGRNVSHAAYDSGYESLSGFNDSFRKIFGVSPKEGRKQQLIHLTRIHTPLGTMIACSTLLGICLLEFSDRRMLEKSLQQLSTSLNATILQTRNPLFEQLETQLLEYFQGKLQKFTVPLHLIGSPFQKKVWHLLQEIPYGSTRSYKEQAKSIGAPQAMRAVARANGMNKIAILIPCHRVIGTDGQLTGYGGGIWRKQHLLNLEQKGVTPEPIPLT